MTTISTAHLTSGDEPPKIIFAGDTWYDVMDETEFYHMMTKDPKWEHGQTFMADVLLDSSDVPQWKVEEHDITYTNTHLRVWSNVVYVLALRDSTWA